MGAEKMMLNKKPVCFEFLLLWYKYDHQIRLRSLHVTFHDILGRPLRRRYEKVHAEDGSLSFFFLEIIKMSELRQRNKSSMTLAYIATLTKRWLLDWMAVRSFATSQSPFLNEC